MADATILEPVLPASPGKPAAYRKLLRNPSVVFGATIIADRPADGAAGALARHHRPDGDQPDRAQQGSRRGILDADATPANASR